LDGEESKGTRGKETKEWVDGEGDLVDRNQFHAKKEARSKRNAEVIHTHQLWKTAPIRGLESSHFLIDPTPSMSYTNLNKPVDKIRSQLATLIAETAKAVFSVDFTEFIPEFVAKLGKPELEGRMPFAAYLLQKPLAKSGAPKNFSLCSFSLPSCRDVPSFSSIPSSRISLATQSKTFFFDCSDFILCGSREAI
jgi:hypothetical protein